MILVIALATILSAPFHPAPALGDSTYGEMHQTKDGSVGIQLPAEWQPAPEGSGPGPWPGSATPLLRLDRQGGQGTMGAYLVPDSRFSGSQGNVKTDLALICEEAGLSVDPPRSFAMGNRAFAISNGQGSDSRNPEVLVIALTRAGQGRILFMFRTTGSDRESIADEGRFALSTVKIVGSASPIPESPEPSAPATPPESTVADESAPTTEEDMEPREIPGYGLTMMVPSDYVDALLQPGFVGPDSYSSIYVVQSPLPIQLTYYELGRETLRRYGGERELLEEVIIDGRKGYLALISYKSTDGKFYEWRLLIGNQERSLVIHASFRSKPGSKDRGILKTALLSTTWDPAVEPISLEGLDFAFATGNRLKIACRAHDSVVLTLPGESVPISISEPLLIIGRVCCIDSSLDLPEAAKLCAFNSPIVDNFEVAMSREIVMGGLPGYEMIGSVSTKPNGMKREYYVAVTVIGKYAYMVQGLQDPFAPEDIFVDFGKVAASLFIH